MNLDEKAAEPRDIGAERAFPGLPAQLGENIETLRQQAARCRRLAALIGDRQTAEALASLADEYQHRIDEIEGSNHAASAGLARTF